jgi:hypothetical protein
MADNVLLYISAAPYLTMEREVLSRATAEIPTSLGWRVTQTPAVGEPLDLEAAAAAHIHLLVLSSDIRAPLGVEWLAARRVGHMPVLFLRQAVPRTLAALAFVRELERYTVWRTYRDAADLHRQALALLTERILSDAIYYQIGSGELERLRAWQEQLEKAARQPEEPTSRGAGAGGVIFSLERYVPSQGQLVGPAEAEE